MAGGEHQEKLISLFYSYSHNDEELRKRLEDHLAALRWNGMIAEWHDRNIDVGDEWAKEIDRNLSSADIILLLVRTATRCTTAARAGRGTVNSRGGGHSHAEDGPL
jgi:hypothetical protein